MTDSTEREVLVVAVHDRVCAIPLAHVTETMRPLALEAMVGTPQFVLGLSLLRGVPTPVVDLAVLLGLPPAVAERWVSLRVEQRQVALAVSTVIAVRTLPRASVLDLPPLVSGAAKETLAALSVLDTQLLLVLRAGWSLPDALWPSAEGPVL